MGSGENTLSSAAVDGREFVTLDAGGKISIVLRREALGRGRARDWNAVVPRAFSPHEL